MKFIDFILGRTTTTTPDYVAGIKGTKSVKIPPTALGAIQLLGKKIGFDMNSTGDQIINLSGGTKFIVTDVVMTNSSVPINNSRVFIINDAPLLAGNTVCFLRNSLTLTLLQSANNFINNFNNAQTNVLNNWKSFAMNIFNPTTVGNNIYASLGTPEGVPATTDIYVYGYILV